MTTILVLILTIGISTIAVAIFLKRLRGETSMPSRVGGALKLFIGPFPLSIAFHVIVLLLLIISVHESRGRELIMVNLEAGGGGGSGSELEDLAFPEVPMPDVAPRTEDLPSAADNSRIAALASDYVRAANNGIGFGRGPGMGSGHGPGIGGGFGGYIGLLRRTGLDIVVVIDGTGSMSMIIDDVKSRINQIARAVHTLVPTARIGIVVYGGRNETIDHQPLTLSSVKLQAFLDNVKAKGGDQWEEDMLGGLRTAVDQMDWRPYASKVLVLVGDSPPAKEDFQPILSLIEKFRAENGTVNTIDVAAEEHERFEREFWLKVHREEPHQISPLPGFARQAETAFTVLAKAGGGSMKSLNHESNINSQVLILAFGDRWEDQIKLYGARLSRK